MRTDGVYGAARGEAIYAQGGLRASRSQGDLLGGGSNTTTAAAAAAGAFRRGEGGRGAKLSKKKKMACIVM
jgi:hypothetical protein